MSKVSKVLDNIALREHARLKAAGDALFASVPVIQMRRVLRAEPEHDLVVPITIDGKPSTITIPGKNTADAYTSQDVDLVGKMLISMQERIKTEYRLAGPFRFEDHVTPRKDPEARSLHAPIRSRVKHKRERFEVFSTV